MTALRFVILILVVWRLTHLIQAEDGPWEIICRIRKAAGNGFWGSLMDCFQCLSLWIALPFGFWQGTGWDGRVLLWLALSGASILLETVTNRNTG